MVLAIPIPSIPHDVSYGPALGPREPLPLNPPPPGAVIRRAHNRPAASAGCATKGDRYGEGNGKLRRDGFVGKPRIFFRKLFCDMCPLNVM